MKPQFKGQLTGFPEEVVEQMLNEQEKQGNKRDVRVFEDYIISDKSDYGFNWTDTELGYDFWDGVLSQKDFNLFFAKYPRKEVGRWRANIGEWFWSIVNGIPIQFINDNYRARFNDAFNSGNYFRTRAQSEEAAKRVKQVLMDYHREIGE